MGTEEDGKPSPPWRLPLIQIPDDRNYVRRGLNEERKNMRIRTIAGAKVVDVQATTAPVHPLKQRKGGGSGGAR
jgi:hypothetical protein